MTEAHTDTGTVLPPDSAALIAADDGLNLFMPKRGEGEQMSRLEILLAAVLVRSRDPEWVGEMVDYFEKLPRS